MSKKLGKILLVSTSAAAASVIAYVGYKKIVNKVKEKREYVTLSNYNSSKDSTIAAIKRAGSDKSDIDE